MKKFICLKQKKAEVYDNLYMEEYKLVIKIPLIKKDKKDSDIEAENFDLASYTIFIPYE